MKLLQSFWNWCIKLIFPSVAQIQSGNIDTKAQCDSNGHVSPPIPVPSIPPRKEITPTIPVVPQAETQPKVEPVAPKTPEIKAPKPKTAKPKKSVESQIAEAAKASVKAPKKAVKKKK